MSICRHHMHAHECPLCGPEMAGGADWFTRVLVVVAIAALAYVLVMWGAPT